MGVGYFGILTKLLIGQQELDSKILVGSFQFWIFYFCDSNLSCKEDPRGYAMSYTLSPIKINGHFLPLLCNSFFTPSAKAAETELHPCDSKQLIPSGRSQATAPHCKKLMGSARCHNPQKGTWFQLSTAPKGVSVLRMQPTALPPVLCFFVRTRRALVGETCKTGSESGPSCLPPPLSPTPSSQSSSGADPSPLHDAAQHKHYST